MLQLLHVGRVTRKGQSDLVGMLDHGSRVLQVLGRRGGQGAGSAAVARAAQVQPGLRAPVAWGRYRGFGVAQQQPALVAALMKSLFFDTCANYMPSIRLLIEGGAGRQHPVRLRDGRCGEWHRRAHRASI